MSEYPLPTTSILSHDYTTLDDKHCLISLKFPLQPGSNIAAEENQKTPAFTTAITTTPSFVHCPYGQCPPTQLLCFVAPISWSSPYSVMQSLTCRGSPAPTIWRSLSKCSTLMHYNNIDVLFVVKALSIPVYSLTTYIIAWLRSGQCAFINARKTPDRGIADSAKAVNFDGAFHRVHRVRI